MSRSVTTAFVRKSFEDEGYRLITSIYKNNRQKLEFICPNDHRHHTTWNKWYNRGDRCGLCSTRRKKSINFVKEQFALEGYKVLDKEYINSSIKINYICFNGHRYSTSWDKWKQGDRCAICAGNAKLSIHDIHMELSREGYKLLSNVYVNNHENLTALCPEGHVWEFSWSNWGAGNRCIYCAGKDKKTMGFLKAEFKKEGHTILTTEYVNGFQILDCLCSEGHNYEVSWNGWRQGQRCPKCRLSGVSTNENIIAEFLRDKCNLEVISRDRNIIKPYELDIVIPELKIAIEYCGLYWHSELVGKNRKYHLSKLYKCVENNYRLITIFEDEFCNNKGVVLSRLCNIVGCNKEVKRVYARKCTIHTIETKAAKKFCEANHLQGYTGSNIKLGAFYNGELVSVMTFAKLSISKGAVGAKNRAWELSRFCSLVGYNVVGIASKLLKYFERMYTPDLLLSYADRRWSDGNLYDKLGFDFEQFTKPNYWFITGCKRTRRFGYRKTKDGPKDIAEWDIRKSQGYNRIWDCGNYRFIKNY